MTNSLEPLKFPNSLSNFVVREDEGWKEVNFSEDLLEEQPLVSVLVQTYQHESFIAETIESILEQKGTTFEILVGEDGSVDRTREICIEYAKKHPESIRLFLHDRTKKISIRGKLTGRYNFITNLLSAKGKYIAICEGDDFWNDPLKLKKQAEYLDSHPNVSLSFHDCTEVNAEGEIINDSLLNFNGRDLTQIDLVQGRRVPTLTAMFRKKDVSDIPVQINEVLNADTFIFAHLGNKGTAKFHDDIELASYRIHAGGIWSAANVLSNSKEIIETFRAICATTSPNFVNIARAELFKKYSTSTIICLRQANPRELAITLQEFANDFSVFSTPKLFWQISKQAIGLIAKRFQRS